MSGEGVVGSAGKFQQYHLGHYFCCQTQQEGQTPILGNLSYSM